MSKPTESSKSKLIKLKKQNQISKLTDARIITKNLVYVIGLSSKLASRDLLLKKEYFGQYGNITKLIVNKNKAYNPNGPKGPSYSAYITFSTHQESSIAILSIDNSIVDDHILRASYGTTKYCTIFLKNNECTNKDCLYLHRLADENEIISRVIIN
jgi:CCR4-NOT transcription complex subunit 4